MKIVTFKVATKIKEWGYPQETTDYNAEVYPLENNADKCMQYTTVGTLSKRFICENYKPNYIIPYAVAPTYLEVWLWLWHKFNIPIEVECIHKRLWAYFGNGHHISKDGYVYKNPEEAIEYAINYIVEHDDKYFETE